MEAILSSTNPKQQKALGRKVKNYDETAWNYVCRDVMKEGCRAKVRITAAPWLPKGSGKPFLHSAGAEKSTLWFKIQFSQNKDLLKELFITEGTVLVEASPFDKKWGIGLGINSEDCLIRSKWPGTNWLGEVLTQLREELLKQKEEDTKLPDLPLT